MKLKDKCPIIQFPSFDDQRGKMVVIEGGNVIPFEINRLFYCYKTDSKAVRGQHANLSSEFVLINVNGKSKVHITDGKEELNIVLDTPMKGIYIPKMIWKDMYEFSDDAVLLVLASTHYDANEYIRDYDEYLEIMNNHLKERN